jgi:hypothetical protein
MASTIPPLRPPKPKVRSSTREFKRESLRAELDEAYGTIAMLAGKLADARSIIKRLTSL